MNNIYLMPSFYSHLLNGLLFFLAAIFLYLHFKSIKNLDSYKVIIIILLFSVAIGIHGLGHLGLEYIYNFNPITYLY